MIETTNHHFTLTITELQAIFNGCPEGLLLFYQCIDINCHLSRDQYYINIPNTGFMPHFNK